MTKRIKDITSQRFHKLVALRLTDKIGGRVSWLCKCDCGNFVKVQSTRLVSGNTKSCGCWNIESAKLKATKHGFAKHPLYDVFSSMKRRCNNPKDTGYKNYGGRGIAVYAKWDHGSFIKWALKNGYKEGLHIDRIDNDGDYSPENCHFTTQAENNKNQRLLRTDNTSGYRGVVADKRLGKWSASVSGKYLGLFKTPLEAAKARDKYVINNNLNLPLNFMR